MAFPKFSIGIDLGTTNCAVSFARLDQPEAQSEIFLVPQFETAGTVTESRTLPSFLYYPREQERPALKHVPGESWVAGRFARKEAGEAPGRVVHSAKSWLGHHAVDRRAAFLPWRSDELGPEERISPIRASALLLAYLRSVWDSQFAAQGGEFANQEITVTVPASFDAVAQRLTLDAAALAGYPAGVRLLEEPQAAFYRWLEQHADRADIWEELIPAGASGAHVLVIDIGGGTSDFSLFEIRRQEGVSLPHVKRVAVSDHLLLGGDNIDLAIAHRVQSTLGGVEISPAQWNFLAARCRDLKERCLSSEGSGDERFSVAVPGRGSRLLGGALTGHITRGEINEIVLEGFFPKVEADAQPIQAEAGLREWALPYAADSAITRYLADFLKDRPRVDAILFNGGSLYPEMLRKRLQEQVAHWQQGSLPNVLENPEPDLAVARGAARFGALLHRKSERIEAGAARSIYIEVHRRGETEKRVPQLLCILPKGTAAEEECRVSPEGLALRVNRPVRFQAYHSNRNEDPAGAIVDWNEHDFFRLPHLEATAKVTARGGSKVSEQLPVSLSAKMNELGVLQLACVSADPRIKESWPLEFELRPHEAAAESAPAESEALLEPGIEQSRLDRAADVLRSQLSRPLGRDKLTANNLLKSLEQVIGKPKAEWNAALIRALWSPLFEVFNKRSLSVDHEEAWLILAGYFLRPGFGCPGDEQRMEELWTLHTDGLAFPGKRVQLQQWILWRRVAGGLSRERQEAILSAHWNSLRTQKAPAAELIRMAGAMEKISTEQKTELVEQFLTKTRELAEANGYCAPYLVALGGLLSRTLFHAGPENVLAPDLVVRAYEALSSFDWSAQNLTDIQPMFLQAARVVEDSELNVPRSTRDRISRKLEKAGVPETKTVRIEKLVPLERSDRSSLFGEALPPGLIFT